MRYFAVLQLAGFMLFCTAPETAGQETGLPLVVLKGEDGGAVTGEEWRSSSLMGKTNLLMYVDTGKKKFATPLIKRIDALSYSPDTLGIAFIVNTKATLVPNFMIRTMCKRREKANENIRYVLDQNEVLIREWDFTDEYLNVMVLDHAGRVLHRHAGEITEEYIDRLLGIIDHAIKTAQEPKG